jgi:hypothetical protein
MDVPETRNSIKLSADTGGKPIQSRVPALDMAALRRRTFAHFSKPLKMEK